MIGSGRPFNNARWVFCYCSVIDFIVRENLHLKAVWKFAEIFRSKHFLEKIMAFELEEVGQVRASELMKLANMTVYHFGWDTLIDRDRDLIFLCLGGKGGQPAERNEPPNYWCLLVGNQSIKLTSYSHFEFISGVDVACEDLNELRVPKPLQAKLSEIQDVIREAFSSYYSQIYKRNVSAQVTFPPPVFY